MDTTELEALVDKLEKDTKLTLEQGTTLKVTDQTDLAAKYLSAPAQLALQKKATTLTYADSTGTYVCIYLGVIVKAENVEKGVERICQALNALANEGLIHSTLAPPGSIELATYPNLELSRAVFAYVLVPASKKEYAEQLAGVIIPEDGNPKAIEDLEIKRREGEFTTTIRITALQPLVNGKKNPKEMVDEQVEQLLAILPKGTELLGVTQCAITDLSIPYVVTFFNPLMKDYKEVQLNYSRHVAKIHKDESISQFNLLDSITYIKR